MVSDQSNPEDEWEEHLYQRANTLISSDELAGKSSEDQKRYVREKLNQLIDEDKGADHLPEIDEPQREEIVKSLVHELVGYGPLEPLVEREDITEIMVNGAKEVYVEKDDAMIETDVEFRDNEHVMRTVRQILAPMGRRVDDDQPFVDARLPDGSRVNVIVPPLIMQGPTVTIRKFQDEFHDLQDLIELGTLNESMVDFLRACVQARINMVISGGTTTGKTTLLNCLSDFIPDDERIVTIEETVELQLQNKHVLQCETRDPNIEGKGEVTARDLLRNSLRMRPDRIIVGEIRRERQAEVLFEAMHTGHSVYSTLHADTAEQTIRRLINPPINVPKT
ncbi:MAG: CpaF family protein, partial [bacterium]